MSDTTIAALIALAGVVVQAILNYYGAKDARRHEIEMKRLELEAEANEHEQRSNAN